MSPRTVRPILVKPSFVHYGDRPAARLSDGALLALAAVRIDKSKCKDPECEFCPELGYHIEEAP